MVLNCDCLERLDLKTKKENMKLKKFVVELTAVRDLDTRVEIEAESADEAMEKALDISRDGGLKKWNEQPGISEVEVNEVEERSMESGEEPEGDDSEAILSALEFIATEFEILHQDNMSREFPKAGSTKKAMDCHIDEEPDCTYCEAIKNAKALLEKNGQGL